jgi:hypothetical protein
LAFVALPTPLRRAVRWRGYATLAAVIVVVGVVPLALDRDSFPLSTYPMFSTRRGTDEVVDTAVVVEADGTVRRLDPQRIAGTEEIILATATVGQAISSGTTETLCAEIAARVARGAEASSNGPRTVQVVTERFDALAWYEGDRTPLERRVHSECPVPR